MSRELERLLRAADVGDPASLRELASALRRAGHAQRVDAETLAAGLGQCTSAGESAGWLRGYLAGLGLELSGRIEAVGRRLVVRGEHALSIERRRDGSWALAEVEARVLVPMIEPVRPAPWLAWAFGHGEQPAFPPGQVPAWSSLAADGVEVVRDVAQAGSELADAALGEVGALLRRRRRRRRR